MALLTCRTCGAEISSDARVTRCKGCGTLFPFECDICGRNLRPPFPVYSDERYLDDSDHPLCDEHFQRQCPSCKTWFQADENPGYFLCRTCLEKRESAAISAPATVAEGTSPISTTAENEESPEDFPRWNEELTPADAEAHDKVTALLFAVAGFCLIAVAGVLVWQIISLLRVWGVF